MPVFTHLELGNGPAYQRIQLLSRGALKVEARDAVRQQMLYDNNELVSRALHEQCDQNQALFV